MLSRLGLVVITLSSETSFRGSGTTALVALDLVADSSTSSTGELTYKSARSYLSLVCLDGIELVLVVLPLLHRTTKTRY